jgi:cation diffusion facilitator CzcD-associated flavoprotein CzcO
MAHPRTVVVVGAGPAGLASAASLKRRGIDATVLEAGGSVATSWRNHYRRLRLHTVKEHSGLPGLPFGRDTPRYPSRDQVVSYLEAYAAHFGIVPHTSEPVRRVAIDKGALIVESDLETYRADVVVVATGMNRVPNPDRQVDQSCFRGAVTHAYEYRDATAHQGQRVLVVGAGNTGAEIALDLLEHGARPTLSVRTPVNVVPRDFLGIPTQVTSIRLRSLPIEVADAVARTVSRLTYGDLSKLGLMRPALGPLSGIARRGRIPLIDIGTIDAIKRGDIVVKPAVARLTEHGAVFTDGTDAPFDAIILATGYRTGLAAIIDVPGTLDSIGRPLDRTQSDPELHFVGYRVVATGLLREIGRQAEEMADGVLRRSMSNGKC